MADKEHVEDFPIDHLAEIEAGTIRRLNCLERADSMMVALILGASIVLAAWLHGLTFQNSFESCAEHFAEKNRPTILCAPGLAQ